MENNEKPKGLSQEAWDAMKIPDNEKPPFFDKWRKEEREVWLASRMDEVFEKMDPILRKEIEEYAAKVARDLVEKRKWNILRGIVEQIKLEKRADMAYLDLIEKEEKAYARKKAREKQKQQDSNDVTQSNT